MLGAELLVYLQLLLGGVFFASADVGLAQAIVSVGEVRVEFECALVVRDGIGVFGLIGVEIAQLELGLGKGGVEFNRFREQRFDLVEIEAGILRALSLPQAHRVVIEGAAIARLEVGKTAESLDDFAGLAGRTVVGAREKWIDAWIRGTQVRGVQ